MKLGAGTFKFSDFANNGASIFDPAGIQGAGPGLTVVEFDTVDKTSFPALKAGDTTALNIVRSQGVAGKLIAGAVFSGFTLRVLPSARKGLYNGLRVAYAQSPLFEDIVVEGVPGSANVPPGESFAIDLVHCDGAVLRRVVVDGKSISGAGVGINSSSNTTLDRCESHHNGSSHGFTAWTCSGVTYLDCVAHDNGSGTGGRGGVGFNCEDSSNTLNVRPVSYRNSLGGFRYYSSASGISKGHRLIGAQPQGVIYQGHSGSSEVQVS